MNKLWWIWEGAAVRDRHNPGNVGKVYLITEFGVRVSWTRDTNLYGFDINVAHHYLIPESNPAVMLAPGLATHVKINRAGWCHYTSVDHDPFVIDRDFLWPQCPDHLKGKTWELPHEKN